MDSASISSIVLPPIHEDTVFCSFSPSDSRTGWSPLIIYFKSNRIETESTPKSTTRSFGDHLSIHQRVHGPPCDEVHGPHYVQCSQYMINVYNVSVTVNLVYFEMILYLVSICNTKVLCVLKCSFMDTVSQCMSK